ncbi:MAG: hypothetical protein FGM15_12035 [Chthoniobacterales bacterium]|nr:hypothetical protein [Chthoniobacterales bacterium]
MKCSKSVRSLRVVTSAFLLAAASSALAQTTRTWDNGAATSVLTTSNNWSGDTLPASTNATATGRQDALFDGTVAGTLNLSFGSAFGGNFGVGLVLGASQTSAVNITNSASAQQTLRIVNSTSASVGGIQIASGAGPLTIGAAGSANPILLALGQGSSALNYYFANNSANTATIEENVTITRGGSHDATMYFNAGDWNVKGVVSNLSAGLLRVEAGTVTLSASNAFTGGVRVGGGTLAIGNNNALGSGALNLNTTTSLTVRSSDANARTITNALTLGTDATFGSVGTGNLTFSGAVTGGSSAKTITVTGITAEFANTITGAGDRAKAGTGTLLLSGNNTGNAFNLYVNEGTLAFTSASALGSGATAIRLGQTTTDGALRYTGSGDTIISRQISVGNGSAAGNNGSATVQNDGSGTLTFNNATFNQAGTAAANRTLTLRGTNTGSNTISGVIVDNSGATVAVTKTDAGKWILSGNNTYTGATTIQQGTLVLSGSNNFASSLTTLIQQGTLVVGNDNAGGSSTINLRATGGVTARLQSDGTDRILANALTFGGDSSSTNYLGGAGSGKLTLNGGVNWGTGSKTYTIDGSTVEFGGAWTGASTANINTIDGTGVATSIMILNGNRGAAAKEINIGNGLTVRANNANSFGSDNTEPLSILGGANTSVVELTNDITLARTLTVQGRDTNNANVALRNLAGSNSLALSVGSTGTRYNIDSQAGTLTISSVSGSTGARDLFVTGAGNVVLPNWNSREDITMNGTGTLTMGGGTEATALSGVATVNSGTLDLNATSTNAALAATNGLVINSGGTVVTRGTGTSIGTNTAVTVNAGGLIDIQKANTFSVLSGAGTIRNTTASNYTNTVESDSNSGTFSGVIEQGSTGTLALTKSGNGTFTLSGNNTFSGGVFIDLGTLVVGNDNALGTGTVNLRANAAGEVARLRSDGTDRILANAITFGGNSTAQANYLGGSGSGKLTLNGAVEWGTGSKTYTVDGSTVEFGGAWTGVSTANTNTIDGTGVATSLLILNGDRGTAAKKINIGNGLTVRANNANSFGSDNTQPLSILGGANTSVVELTNDITLARTLTVQGRDTNNANVALRNLAGNNSLALSVGSTGTRYNIDSQAGTLTISSVSGSTGARDLFVTGAGNVVLPNWNSRSNLTMNGTGTLTMGGGANQSSLTGVATVNSGTLDLNAASGTGALAATGGLVINSGGTVVTRNAGTSIGTTTAVTVNAGGLLDVQKTNTIGALSGAGTIRNTTATDYTLTVNNDNGSSTFTGLLGKTSTGNLSLTKNGTGTFTLGGTNTHNLGATTVSAGTLVLAGGLISSTNNISVAASGTLQLAGGSVSVNNGAGYILNSGVYDVNGQTVAAGSYESSPFWAANAKLMNSSATAALIDGTGGKNNIWINAAGAVIDTVGDLTISSTINDNGSAATRRGFTKTGAGVLTLSGANNSYGGETRLAAGGLSIGSATALQNSTLNLDAADAGTVTAIGQNSTLGGLSGSRNLDMLTRTLSIGNNNASTTYSGVLSNGALIKIGTGTLTLSGVNTYGGGTFLNGGWLTAGHTNAFGSGSITVGSGTTLNLTNFVVANQIVNNGGTILSTGQLSDVVATDGTTDIGGNDSTIAEVSGSATVNVSGSGVTVNQASGGTLNVSGSNASVAALSGGTVNANAAGLVVTNFSGGNIAVSNGVTVALRGGSSSGVVSGSGGIAKQSAGTLTLTASNTYTGATTIEAGKLVVNGSLATNSTVTINSGGALGGGGTVGSTVVASGATITPGNSPGTLTINGDLTWNNGGSYDWEVFRLPGEGTAGTDWDLLSVTGSLNLTNLTGSPLFNINLYSMSSTTTYGSLTNWSPTGVYAWKILEAGTAINGSYITPSYFNINTANFQDTITGLFALELRDGGTGLYLTYNGGGEPVPEPGTWASAALLAGLAFWRWRRRSPAPQA